MKKTLFTPLLAFISFWTLPAQTWTKVTSLVGTSDNLNSISYIDSNIGIVGGGPSTVLETNTGINWNIPTFTSTTSIINVQFINANTIYAIAENAVLGGNGYFYRSTNGGLSFTDTLLPIYGTCPNNCYGLIPYEMVFLDSLNGYVCGSYYNSSACNCYLGEVLKTTDGGLNWQQCLVPNYQFGGIPPTADITSVSSMSFVNTQVGFILASIDYGGVNDSLYKTTDGGLTWSNYFQFSNGQSPNCIYFQNKDTGWAPSSNGHLFKTTNGGASWGSITTNTSDNFTKILFTDSLHGWLLGTSTIYHSCDAGATWSVSGTFNNTLNDICMLNNSQGYAVGDSGYVYKFSCSTYNINLTQSICNGQSYSVGAQTYNATGNFTTSLIASNCGCDSIVSLNLTVNTLPNPSINYNSGVFSTGTFAHYQWLYNGAAVTGDTLQSLTPSFVGNYSVIVTNANGCSDTSASSLFTSIETVNGDAPNISLYPNPATQSCTIYISNVAGDLYDAQLIDMTGKEVNGIFSKKTFDNDSFTFPVSQYAKGIYMLKITNSNGQHVVKKLIVE